MTSGASDKPYAGTALARVNAGGRVRLPDFVRRVLERHPSSIFVGLHPEAPCLLAFDTRYRDRLHDELHEGTAAAGEERRARLRRVFGTSQEIGWPCDHIRLPDVARRKAMIGAQALFIGIGGALEIWDPGTAAASGDEILEELAALQVAQAGRA